jgi:transposase
VVKRVSEGQDLLAGLRRIGVDEISYRRGQRYLIVIVDHDTGRLVWAKPGRDRKTLEAFFDELGEERSKALTHISADAADWIGDVVAERAPQAVPCLDPFLNTRIRLIARRAFGFHGPEALIALAKLGLSGLCPSLPGRSS